MKRYVVRRLFLVIPTLFLLGTFLFFMLRVLPGDVVHGLIASGGGAAVSQEEMQRVRKDLGLLDPLYKQYGRWLWNTLRGDLGHSVRAQSPVRKLLLAKVQVTAALAVMAMTLSLAVALPMGIVSAVWRGSWIDQGIRAFTAAGLAMPTFWVGIVILLMLLRIFRWSPPIQFYSFFDDPGANLGILFIPALILGYRSAALITRLVRSMMLEVLNEDYIRTARSKGLPQWRVIVRHALPNASLPVITLAALNFSAIVEGAVVIEVIFNLPGLGSMIQQAVFTRDFALVLGVALGLAVFTLVWILFVDLLYAWLDPRIRYA
jgi:peptide/nickel transport system permease protein